MPVIIITSTATKTTVNSFSDNVRTLCYFSLKFLHANNVGKFVFVLRGSGVQYVLSAWFSN